MSSAAANAVETFGPCLSSLYPVDLSSDEPHHGDGPRDSTFKGFPYCPAETQPAMLIRCVRAKPDIYREEDPPGRTLDQASKSPRTFVALTLGPVVAAARAYPPGEEHVLGGAALAACGSALSVPAERGSGTVRGCAVAARRRWSPSRSGKSLEKAGADSVPRGLARVPDGAIIAFAAHAHLRLSLSTLRRLRPARRTGYPGHQRGNGRNDSRPRVVVADDAAVTGSLCPPERICVRRCVPEITWCAITLGDHAISARRGSRPSAAQRVDYEASGSTITCGRAVRCAWQSARAPCSCECVSARMSGRNRGAAGRPTERGVVKNHPRSRAAPVSARARAHDSNPPPGSRRYLLTVATDFSFGPPVVLRARHGRCLSQCFKRPCGRPCQVARRSARCGVLLEAGGAHARNAAFPPPGTCVRPAMRRETRCGGCRLGPPREYLDGDLSHGLYQPLLLYDVASIAVRRQHPRCALSGSPAAKPVQKATPALVLSPVTKVRSRHCRVAGRSRPEGIRATVAALDGELAGAHQPSSAYCNAPRPLEQAWTRPRAREHRPGIRPCLRAGRSKWSSSRRRSAAAVAVAIVSAGARGRTAWGRVPLRRDGYRIALAWARLRFELPSPGGGELLMAESSLFNALFRLACCEPPLLQNQFPAIKRLEREGVRR